MDGRLGSFTIKPDQMQVINPFLILGFIPLFNYLIYPILAKLGIRRPLQKMTCGGILAGIAFVISGLVELSLEKTYPVIPGSTEGQLRIFNGNPCDYRISPIEAQLENLDYFESKHIPLEDGNQTIFLEFSSDSCLDFNRSLLLIPGKSISAFIEGTPEHPKFEVYEDAVEKSGNGFPLTRILSNFQQNQSIELIGETMKVKENPGNKSLLNFHPGTYKVVVENQTIEKYELQLGGVYTILISQDGAKYVSFPAKIFPH
jgi:solute carrier family 15 oligopeptide transporter 1